MRNKHQKHFGGAVGGVSLPGQASVRCWAAQFTDKACWGVTVSSEPEICFG